ncbi:uncharacterized protein [Triticum aestivum]|uniref:uncharacterized protein n=1 Tax=Triticum aestivum TaxID=4565 RepID=UPI001D0239F4|nr:uncharacterized protein LOC123129529 [Triticum aestivum]
MATGTGAVKRRRASCPIPPLTRVVLQPRDSVAVLLQELLRCPLSRPHVAQRPPPPVAPSSAASPRHGTVPRRLGLTNLAETLPLSLVATSEQHRWSHAPSATTSARIRRPPRPIGAPATIAIVLALSTSRLRFLHGRKAASRRPETSDTPSTPSFRRDQQVRRTPSSTTLSARTTTADSYLSIVVGFVKFNGEPRSPRIRQVRRCKYHSEPCTTTVAEDQCTANVKFD